MTVILGKMLELEKEKYKDKLINIIIWVIGGKGALISIGLLCYRLVRINFS